MMKYILVSLLISVHINLYAQSIKNGYIIDAKVSHLGLAASNKIRYTPSIWDAKKADVIVLDNKLEIQKTPGYHQSQKKDIFSRYNRYYKQYIGFINEKGEKIILINYLPKKIIKRNIYNVEDPIIVLDGGNDYWQIEVNIDTKQLLSIHINGEM